jgi:adenine-specific DNA-methyltransferase
MAHIDALIDKVADPALRQALRDQVDTMLNKQSFGLVYQQHKPETVELHHYKVRRGCKVRILSEDDGQLYRVEKVAADKATIVSLTDSPERWDVEISDVVVVREFGEPVYPGLKSISKVERGGEKAPHVVVNAENFHALETLLYTHEGKIDAIYIDPPYNSGARDWKYNNDYVDGVDQYRHSKWLAFMERRLGLARRLLAPTGTLVVTIDEHEVHHLGMLLEQMFPIHNLQMVTAVINPKGVTQDGLSRVEEYIFYVSPPGVAFDAPADDLLTFDAKGAEKATAIGSKVRWQGLLHSGEGARRQDRENMFYPVLIDEERGAVVGAGEALIGKDPVLGQKIDGYTAAWPVRSDGSWGRWYVSAPTLRALCNQGYTKLGGYDAARQTWAISYLYRNLRNQIDSGVIQISNFDRVRNTVELTYAEASLRRIKTVWHRTRHDAGAYGADLIATLLGDRRFPFPKAIYSVADTLRPIIRTKRDAVVLDFFAGSGTTTHAVAYLNAEDGGNRRSILVTNNEVSVAEAAELRKQGYAPGDVEWESLGIFHHVTRPRIEAAVTGRRADGAPLAGTYLTGARLDEGFDENVEFFDLTYEDPDLISLGRKFQAVAPLLWLKAGGRGARIERAVATWSLPDDALYGVLFDTDQWREFVDAVKSRGDEIAHAYVVTDSEATFQQILTELPSNVPSTQLYGDYLRTFEINTKGRV